MTDFIRVLNMANNSANNNITIEDIYNFRKLNREIYTKGDLIGDLNGDLLKIRDVRKINLISVDLSMFSITLEDSDNKKLSLALDDINSVLKSFLRRFSYLSSLTAEDADKYEYYLNMYSMIDIVRCGNSVVVTL